MTKSNGLPASGDDGGPRVSGRGNGVSTRSHHTPVETVIHLVAGGAGGTAGAIVTCPLEVVKTRLQSSNSGFGQPEQNSGGQGPRGGSSKASVMPHNKDTVIRNFTINLRHNGQSSTRVPSVSTIWSHERIAQPRQDLVLRLSSSNAVTHQPQRPLPSQPMNVIQCLRYIIETEGPRSLFRGLGPNLVGVAPSRAIYFFTYSSVKKQMNENLPKRNRDTPFVHVISAALAGFSASTCTNPIWLVKTRLQLDRACGNETLSVRKCIQKIFNERGILGFWRGVTASYWGISETVIHFVIYESLRKQVTEYQLERHRKTDEKTFVDFFGFMLCGACSKTVATIIAYPHEVVRTRLREEGSKYISFWQTFGVVAKEEGRAGLYRGLVTQLIRQIPNTAIMMATYELTVYLLVKALIDGQSQGGQAQHQPMEEKRLACSRPTPTVNEEV